MVVNYELNCNYIKSETSSLMRCTIAGVVLRGKTKVAWEVTIIPRNRKIPFTNFAHYVRVEK